jgi:hypothetical protein
VALINSPLFTYDFGGVTTLNSQLAMSIIQRLPYDILEQIAALMDKKSLRKAALASRALNEIFTRFLYSSVIFNKPVQNPYRRSSKVRIVGPFGAFDRRPLLRNAVRVVVLYSKCRTKRM